MVPKTLRTRLRPVKRLSPATSIPTSSAIECGAGVSEDENHDAAAEQHDCPIPADKTREPQHRGHPCRDRGVVSDLSRRDRPDVSPKSTLERECFAGRDQKAQAAPTPTRWPALATGTAGATCPFGPTKASAARGWTTKTIRRIAR